MKKYTLKNGLQIEYNIKESVVVKHILIEIPGKYDSQFVEAAIWPNQKEEEIIEAQINGYVKQHMPTIAKEIEEIENKEAQEKAIQQELDQNKEHKDKYWKAIIIQWVDKDWNGFIDLVTINDKEWKKTSFSPSRGDLLFDDVEKAQLFFEWIKNQIDVTKIYEEKEKVVDAEETQEEKTLDRDLLQKAFEEWFTYFVNITTEDWKKYAVLHDVENAIKLWMEYDKERWDMIFDNKKEAEEYVEKINA